MNRRQFLGVAALGTGLSPMPRLAVSQRRGDTVPHLTIGPPDAVEPADWYPHYEFEIRKDGTATVTLTAHGNEVPESLFLSNRFVAGETFLTGESAISRQQHGYNWRPATANPIRYEVQLGEGYGKSGYFQSAVLDQSIVSIIHEVLAVSDWKGTPQPDTLPTRHRFTFDPPDGWVSVAPGKQVDTNTYDLYPNRNQFQRPFDMFIVGDIDVRHVTDVDPEIRFVELPSADGPDQDELIDVLVQGQQLLEDYYGIDTRSARLAFVPPPEVEPSGATMGGDAIAIHANQPLDNAKMGFLSEQVHTYQRFREPNWQFEGQTTWLMMLLMFDMGEFTEQQFLDKFHYDVRTHEVTVPAADSVYDKGRAIMGALDVDIRARTDDAADVGNYLRRTNDQRLVKDNRLDRPTQLAALFDITGIDYTDFYERFVDGTDYPQEVFSDAFSVSDPILIESFAALKYPRIEETTNELIFGDQWGINLDVHNIGNKAGGRTIELFVGKTAVDSTEFNLQPGESTTVSFEHTFDSIGDQEVRVPPVYRETITVQRAVILDNIELVSETVPVGEPVTVRAAVRNLRETSATRKFVLKLDEFPNDRLTDKEIDIAGQTTAQVELSYTFEKPGEYPLEVNGNAIGTVTVTEPTPTPSASPSPTQTQRPTQTPTKTEGQTPGMGILSAMAGIGSVVGYLLARDGDRTEE